MIYGLRVLILIVALAALSFLSKRKNDKKKLLIVNLVIALFGALLLVASYFIGIDKIAQYQSDIDLFGWLSDYYSLYYDIALPVFYILLAVNGISSASFVFERNASHKIFVVLRELLSLLSSLLLLLLPYIGFITQNQYVDMHKYMIISGVGMALAIRYSNAISLIKRTKINKD